MKGVSYMAKINQIQKKLKETSGQDFQKLADAYLHKKGYEQINPLGSVIGANKVRRGTPDTLIQLENGKYVFVEYTTTQGDVYKKLNEDLDKCFNEEKTGVSIEKIDEIILCHTSNIDVADQDALREKCQLHGVKLNIFGIGPISFDLYQKYPGIARDFLGVNVDTGQIVSIEEFISIYNNGTLATSLDTTFYFRENELERTLQGLEDGNLIIISGRAGVGKTRFALECCKRFGNMYSEYNIRCIFNRGPDLFEDLSVHFSEPNCYLILVDDANRINKFEYVLQLLRENNEKKRIKVIATVRDYVADKIKENIASLNEKSIEISLSSLDDEQIKSFVESEYDIKNPFYKERISDIAQGNSRLAIMAAQIAKQENTLSSISEVSALYDKYYGSVCEDLKELKNRNFLKVIGIVAFFRVMDKTNEERMKAIEEIFEISVKEFWQLAKYLCDLEIFDIYDNEVVRISDQVLGTYLFYFVFLKKEILKFSILLENFFPKFRNRFSGVLNPIMSVFDSDMIIKKIKPHVDKIWKRFEEEKEDDKLFKLMRMFYFVKETDTLLYIREKINKMEKESVDFSKIKFELKSNISSSSFLKIICCFNYSIGSTLKMVLNLIFDYFNKRPQKAPQVLHILIEVFGFKHTSHLRNFKIQEKIIDILWKRAEKEKGTKLFSKLFLIVANKYLYTRFHNTESKERYKINMINFELPAVPRIFELRKKIWDRLFQLYNDLSFKDELLDIIYDYSTAGHLVSVKEIVEKDAEEIFEFIEKELKPSKFRHCLVVQNFLKHLNDLDISFEKEISNKFENEAYKIYKLLSNDWVQMGDYSYKEYQKIRKEQIKDHFINYNFEEFKEFFKICLKVQEGLKKDHKSRQLQEGIKIIFIVLSNCNPSLYIKVLTHYLKIEDPFNLRSCTPIQKLMEICNYKKAYRIIDQFEYSSKPKWLFCFYRHIPSDEINRSHLNNLYNLYKNTKIEKLPNDLDFLFRYDFLGEQVIIEVTDIILKRTRDNPSYARAISLLFNPNTKVNKRLLSVFDKDIDLLKRAYFSVSKVEQYADYTGENFKRILDFDSNFIYEYIDWRYNQKDLLSYYDDHRNYSFLWERNDYKELMKKIAEYIYAKERGQERLTYRHTYLKTFFDNENVEKNQDEFLKYIIEQKYNDSDFMNFIFNIIAQFNFERRLKFISLFIKHNKDFEDFKTLPFEPGSWGSSGSAVPMYQKRIEYFESMLIYLDTVELLEHKQYIEKYIQKLRERMENEKKKDFMDI